MVDAKTSAIKLFISDFSRRSKSPWYRLLYKALLLPMTDSSAGRSYILQVIEPLREKGMVTCCTPLPGSKLYLEKCSGRNAWKRRLGQLQKSGRVTPSQQRGSSYSTPQTNDKVHREHGYAGQSGHAYLIFVTKATRILV